MRLISKLNFISKLKLRGKLLAGFLLCAALAAASGGAAVYSLWQIEGRMRATASGIGDLIDRQDAQSRQFGELRKQVSSITVAQDVAALNAVGDTLSTNDTQIADSIDTLLKRKREQLEAADELAELQRQSRTLLTDISRRSAGIATESETSAQTGITTTAQGVRTALASDQKTIAKDLDSIAERAGQSLVAIKAAMAVRSRGHELAATVKDALLAKDAAAVDYARNTVKTLIDNTKEELGNLPDADATKTMNESLAALPKLIANVLDAKKKLLNASAKDAKTQQKKLDEAAKAITAVVATINDAAMETADSVEFDSTLAMDDALSAIKTQAEDRGEKTLERMESLSKLTSNGMSTINRALGIDTMCQELSAMAKDTLLATNTQRVEKLQQSTDALIKKVDATISQLPSNDATASVRQALSKLQPMLDSAIATKKKMLVAEQELEKTAADVARQMTVLDTQMLDDGQAMKADANDNLETTSELVSNWQTGQSILALVAVAFAIAIGIIASQSILNPIRRTVALLKDMAQGDADLTKRLPMKKINCSKAKKCGNKQCAEYGKEANCWDTVGSNAKKDKLSCPSILSGKLASCHECSVMQSVIRDETDEIAAWLNTFIGRMSRIIYEIIGTANTLNQSSTDVSNTATDMASEAGKATTQSTTASVAAQQMATDMNAMAESTGQMTNNLKSVATAVQELTASINEIAGSAEQASGVSNNAAELVETSNKAIGQLGAAANEIGQVIDVIQEIAEQTNLLALNATIEAARAGDAGRGFAVVATEVKELAKQTADATEGIRSRIEGIQTSTHDAVGSIDQISVVINEVKHLSSTMAAAVEEQNVTTHEIAQTLNNTSLSAESILEGVSRSATASTEITHGITDVDEAAKQTARGAQQTQEAGVQLSQLSGQLQELVSQFKV